MTNNKIIIEKAEELIVELTTLIRVLNADQDAYHKIEYCLSLAQDIDALGFRTGGEDNEE